MMRETGQLEHTGLKPRNPQWPQQLQSDPEKQEAPLPPTTAESTTRDLGSSSDEGGLSSSDCLMEKVSMLTHKLDSKAQPCLGVPYVGPRTCLQFLECFCGIFRQKSAEAVTERTNLTKALETLESTRKEVEVTREKLIQLKQQLETTSNLSQQLLTELTAKACQLESLRAILGELSYQMYVVQV